MPSTRRGSVVVTVPSLKERDKSANEQIHRNYALRLTWQATARNKINFSYEKDRRITPLRRVAANVSPEATTYTPFYPNAIGTVWKSAREQISSPRRRLHGLLQPGLGRAGAARAQRAVGTILGHG